MTYVNSETVLTVAVDNWPNNKPAKMSFHVGDLLQIATADRTYTGRLKRVDDYELELDISQKFNSKIVHIPFCEVKAVHPVCE
jgi:hypothetical protein